MLHIGKALPQVLSLRFQTLNKKRAVIFLIINIKFKRTWKCISDHYAEVLRKSF